MTHESRIGAIVSAFEEAMARFRARLSSADPAAAERVPDGGGWTPAQVAAHVAMVNVSFASVIDGSRPAAQPAPDGFVERSWQAIADGIPEKLEAPSRAHPPAGVGRDAAIASLAASETQLVAALRGLDAGRAGLTIESPIVGGRVSLYQVGEWAVAHVIRHNRQVKRLLGGGAV